MIIYINDIFIYSKIEIEYKIHVNKVLASLREAKFKIKIEKLIFHTQTVDFFKYIIISKKVAMKREKLNIITL